MDILSIVAELEKIAKVKKVKPNEYEIITGAKINAKQPVKIYLRENFGFKFCDNKHTLKYMSDLYELKSIDVKNCIVSVIKLYGFTIVSGEIIANIKSQNSLIETFYNFIMCIGQLANMYAFFDKPE